MFIKERFYARNTDNYVEGINYNNETRLTLDELVDVMERFTATYRSMEGSHRALREAACFRVLYPAMLLGVDAYDRIVGRADIFPIGLGHQYINNQFGFVCRGEWFEKMLADPGLDIGLKRRLEALYGFWRHRTTISKVEDRKSSAEKKYVHGITWDDCPASITKSFRIAGIFVDYEKLLNLGIDGLCEEIRCCKSLAEYQDPELFQGMIESFAVVSECAIWYAEQCQMDAEKEKNAARKEDLIEMARILRKIAHAKPDTFREALQLVFLYNIIAGPREWGRMDDYLADYYDRDLRHGIITEEEAINLLISGWKLMIVKEQITDDRVIIGGRGRKHERRADQLAMVIMEASRRLHDIVPQLTLRLYDGMAPELYEKALDCIGEGCTYPMLYNDDVVIPGIMNIYGLDESTAEDWLPFGCGEFVVNHRVLNTPNSLMNLANVLIATLNGGIETVQGLRIAPGTACLTDYESFEDLFDAYAANVDALMEIGVEIEGRTYRVLNEDMSINLLTPLYDDCLKRGKGLIDGGAVVRGGNCEMYGLVTAADSLYAIKKLVYDEKLVSREEMLLALRSNFEGYEHVRALCRNAEKFGNDLEDVDRMMKRVHELVCCSALTKSGKFGVDRYSIVNINNKGNTMFGRLTGATPDGRCAGDSLSNGNNPSSGMDKNGMTAFLNSLLKARTDNNSGIVQNMKFSKETFRNLREKVVKPMLDAYFKNGGSQAMITVVGREDLENAMRCPEKYSNLIVRVGGFSARYVELDRDVQIEILNRTEY